MEPPSDISSSEEPPETRTSCLSESRPLYLISDGGGLRVAGKLVSTLRAVLDAVPNRVSYIQLREQVAGSSAVCSDDELIALSLELKPHCLAAGVGLLVNRNPTVCVAAELDGIHIGKPLDLITEEREALGDRIIGYSAHSCDEAIGAFSFGADYVVLSPIYPPLSKISKRPPIGVKALRELRGLVDKPVLALGGVTPSNIAECRAAGATGVAVISSILSAPDPAQAARLLVAAWDQAEDSERSVR